MKSYLSITLFIAFSATFYCQTYTWIGGTDANFFNESNWVDSNTGIAPTGNPITGGVSINRTLIISNIASVITAASEINLGSGSLSITNATITANAIRGGVLNINENGYLNLDLSDAFRTTLTQVNLNSGIGWVRTKLIAPDVIQSTYINQFKINAVTASYPTNIRFDNYYLGGTVIRSNVASTSPVTLYDRVNLNGTSVSLTVDAIHSGNNITNMNNKTSSFLLRKGFMMTIADDEAGTGKSKNYIASEEDLIVNEMPTNLKDNVSFVRVIPWNWVNKKGIGSNSLISGLDNTWFYRWSNSGLSTIDVENPPMAWGASAADDDTDITLYKQKYKTTHVMGFNEPDDCNAQSGQFRNLCDEDVAVGYYRNLMKTGLRLVSPAGREEAPSGWLQNFYDKATAQDIRIDVIAVHWYDWGNNPAVNTNPTAQQVFDRFKTYLNNVYNRFGKPIWITEFNANPNRSNSINLAFMQLALPYLETLDYVERYAWFEPSSDVADFYDGSNNLTNVGTFYKNQVSTPSIPENTITANNNIDDNYSENPTLNHNILTNGNFDTGDLRAWLGTNNQVLMDNDGATNQTTNYRFENVAQINDGIGSLYQIIEVAPSVSYTVSFDYKWVSGAGTNNQIARVYRDLSGTNSIGSVTLNTNPGVWYTATFNFTAPSNVFKARLFFDKASGNNPLRINNVRVRLNPNKTWSGTINNDWNTIGNWTENAVPLTTDVVFIPRDLTNYPTVSGDLTLSQLVIDSGASYITSGTTNGGVTGGTTYYVELNDDNWHLVSSPVATQVMNTNWVAAAGIATGQGSNIAIGNYDNTEDNPTTGPWRYFTGSASNFDNGKGFAMKKLSKGMFIFNGNIASRPKSINITQGAITSWNLIGNPFPSYINVENFLTANTTLLKNTHEAVYVWNAETESYSALTDGFIHPGQGFFVNSNLANTTVSVTADMLSHQKNQTFYKSENVQSPQIILNLSDGTNFKQTEINYLDGKTTGLDPRFDIGLFDGVTSDFSVFSHLVNNNEGIPFMRQALPNTDFENTVIPIGIKVTSGKEITFSVNATNLPEGIFVFLEDKQNNTITRMDEKNSNYKVTISENNNMGRFFIHTKGSNILSTDKFDIHTVSIYKTNNETLKILGLSNGKTNIQLFNIVGKQVLNTYFEVKNYNEITLPKVTAGIYVLKLQHEKGNITKKIVIE
ncbi:glycosyl hydrolase [Polaribacter sp.]|uniref:glycosyl hydrolase n=3 Tax=Polaribacter sp. TaxID=1920175 RepID=UPI004047660D